MAEKVERASLVKSSSVGSFTSGASTSSSTSRLRRAAKNGMAMLKVLRSDRSSLASGGVAEGDLRIGDSYETVSMVLLRREEDLDSRIVMELPVGAVLYVKEVGADRRVQVSTAHGAEGWITYKSKKNEPHIMRRKPRVTEAVDDFEVGGRHEVKSLVTLRSSESLDSAILFELYPGEQVTILELGTINRRRARVAAKQGEGWMSVVTKDGELLIGMIVDDIASMPKPKPGPFGSTGSSKKKVILEAARSGDVRVIQKCVERSSITAWIHSTPNLNCGDVRGKTPLIFAAAFGNVAVVDYLLSRSEVQVNLVDDTGKTALHHLCKRARPLRNDHEFDTTQASIAAKLLQAKAHLEARDIHGCTALMFAVANGDVEVVQTLLAEQANVKVKDFSGQSPLAYAWNFGRTKIADMLRDAGADDSDEDAGVSSTSHVERETTASGTTPGQSVAASDDGAVSGSFEDGAVDEALGPGVDSETGPNKKGKKIVRKVPKGGKDPKNTSRKGRTKEKRSSRLGAGMLEMQEAFEQGGKAHVATAISVLPDPEEEGIDSKEQARRKLQFVMAETPTVLELERAIQDAQLAGVAAEDIKTAEVVLQAMRSKWSVREALREAVLERNVPRLKETLRQAEEAKVGQDEIEKAKAILQMEEPKLEARNALRAAQDSGSRDALKAAIAAAKQAKLSSDEILPFKEMLSAFDDKEKALSMLTQAMQERNVGALRVAIQQAKTCAIHQGRIDEAEAILRLEEPKQQAREEVADACHQHCTIDALEKAIARAKEVGLEDSEYAEAVTMLANELEKIRALEELNAVLGLSMDVDLSDLDALKECKDRLSLAIQVAKDNGVREADLADAEARRRKIHNCIEDIKGSIRVFCRVRPLSNKERNQGDAEVTKALDGMTLELDEHEFAFDAVFNPGTQEEVFEDCKDLVQSAVDGYNVTMFAYGQTGAGKTFTMMGIPGAEGTAPRTIHEIFNVIERGQDRYTYTVMGSMLELYNNDLVDLLLAKGGRGAKLAIRTDKSGNVAVEGLTEEECRSPEDLMTLLDRGINHRTMKATAMNSESSRSHFILIIKIISVNRETKAQIRGKVLIVDLAGSERLKKSQVTAEMQKEAIEINKSLTALGDVIESLTKGEKLVPYRNHKLTMLMQDSLGGASKTLMFVNCSPANSNQDETMMSLKYATRAKKITNTAKKNAS